MADRSPTKNVKLFRWVLPLIYLGALGVLIIGNISGAGHTPPEFDFLINVISAPCYLLTWMPVPNSVVGLLVCPTFGTIFFFAIGWVIDLLLNRLRVKRMAQS
jgi:hypothetical protein